MPLTLQSTLTKFIVHLSLRNCIWLWEKSKNNALTQIRCLFSPHSEGRVLVHPSVNRTIWIIWTNGLCGYEVPLFWAEEEEKEQPWQQVNPCIPGFTAEGWTCHTVSLTDTRIRVTHVTGHAHKARNLLLFRLKMLRLNCPPAYCSLPDRYKWTNRSQKAHICFLLPTFRKMPWKSHLISLICLTQQCSYGLPCYKQTMRKYHSLIWHFIHLV